MPSYQAARKMSPGPGGRARYTAAVQVSAAALEKITGIIAAHHRKISSPCRLASPGTQAVLTLAYLRTNLTYAELAHGNGISVTTCWRIVTETVKLMAGRAIRLADVLRLARKAGWEYLLVDGTLVPTVAFGRKITARQEHYSGKHKQHGVNIQTACSPAGDLLRASAALPGRTADVTACRAHQLDKKLSGLTGVLADLGCKGLDQVITGYKRKRGQKELTPGQRAANRVHASLRCLGERGNAQLKRSRVLATELRCRPGNCTGVVKACLCLHHLENDPFTPGNID